MDLRIKKDKRNTGKYFFRNGGIKSNAEIKSIASREISSECGKDKFFNKNYLVIESVVLSTCDNIVDMFYI